MKVTRLYVYPIKALRPASVTRAHMNRRGFEHDRRFMLVRLQPDGSLKNVQTIYFPECTRFFQEIVVDDDDDDDEEGAGHIVVTYRAPREPLVVPAPPEQATALRVPLRPDTAGLRTIDITLMDSTGTAYRMSDEYNSWFSACLGYEVILVYLGDGKRPVLAHAPPSETAQPAAGGWLSTIASYVMGSSGSGSVVSDNADDGNWLTFNEAAPLLVTSEASLDDVSARLPEGQTMDMMRFRPNIVVDGMEKWDEDFWGELQLGGTSGEEEEEGGKQGGEQQHSRLALTANCARCLSINIDYDTGRVAEGEAGAMLKKLMKDRRVDAGNKWSPIFGRYAFLLGQSADVAVGDEVTVTKRISDRDVWAWPKSR